MRENDGAHWYGGGGTGENFFESEGPRPEKETGPPRIVLRLFSTIYSHIKFGFPVLFRLVPIVYRRVYTNKKSSNILSYSVMHRCNRNLTIRVLLAYIRVRSCYTEISKHCYLKPRGRMAALYGTCRTSTSSVRACC